MGNLIKKIWQGLQQIKAMVPKKRVAVKVIAGYKDIPVGTVVIKQTDAAKFLSFSYSVFVKPVEYEVVGITWNTSEKRSLGKAVIGAAIGTVLTGGLGLIAGGVIGGRRKDNSTAVITLMDQGSPRELHLKATGKTYKTLTELI